MKILTSGQIREADSYTIKNEPVASIDLMERAATVFTEWLIKNYNTSTSFKIFAGPGNNGGDGWAVARLLAERGYRKVNIYLLRISDKLSPDSEINRQRLEQQNLVKIKVLESGNDFPEISGTDIIIEGLFGSGLTRPLSGLSAILVNYLNNSGSRIISIDIPGGLFGEDNSKNDKENIIKADCILTFQFPKLSFFFPENEKYVGQWHVLPIGLHQGFIDSIETPYNYVTPGEVIDSIKVRKKFAHKGTFGHGLLIAGSYGMMGAAILGAKAALRTGIGLVTSHIPRLGYEIIQTAVPEAIISIDKSDTVFTDFPELGKFNAVAVGPGLGCDEISVKALKKLLKKANMPLVIDADALNIISANKELMEIIPENSILTPHPREFERLAGSYKDNFTRNKAQMKFAKKHKIYVVLKGAYTAIACPDGKCYFNTTGNPGMATAGSGDVLTGIILALMAQNYTPEDAALTGVFVHGLAGDIAVKETGESALIASDIINNISGAFIKLNVNKK
ncbi:MAG: NAD(P)H-hydrate dehydratase [Bacteroidales bacterium]|nr:MAG: NAD(P)H-hydrate dehydratase [Bacteroidales bacterium]